MKTFYYVLILCSFIITDNSYLCSQTVYAWGNNKGTVGDGTYLNRNSPIQVIDDNIWTKVEASASNSFAIRKDSTLWAWGYSNDDSPYLGNGSGDWSMFPIHTAVFGKWIDISMKVTHALAIRSDGTLWAWGLNQSGLLGDGTEEVRAYPVQIGKDNDWASIATGNLHSAAIKRDGSLWVWGNNEDGHLGLGDANYQFLVPTRLGTDNDWVEIRSGYCDFYAIKADNSLWVWGSNYFNVIGTGTEGCVLFPVQIGYDYDWVEVSAGMHNALAIKSDGSLWAWGINEQGQIGDGTTINRDIPTKISDAKWKSICVGGYHCAGIKIDGTLWTWGFNLHGQLGTGSNIDTNVPTQVGSDGNWRSVSTGKLHTMAVKKNVIYQPGISVTTSVYPTLICEKEKYFYVTVTNTGNSTLRISKLSFDGIDKHDFEFVDALPINISAGKEIKIKFKFRPVSPGLKTAEAVIESNVKDNPIYRTSIDIKYELIDYSTSIDSIDFGMILVNSQAKIKFNMTNHSSITTTFILSSSPNLSVSRSEITIASNTSSQVTVTYLGSSTETEIQGFVNIWETTCNKSSEINAKGSVLANIPMLTGMMKASSLSGFPGDEVELSISLENAKNLVESGVTGLSAELQYNPTMLFPIDYSQTKIDDNVAMIKLNSLPAQSGELAKVKFIVGLGNAETSNLALSNITAIGGKADIQTEKGIFTLLGICREGGTRLINSSKRAGITQLLPNPVVNNLDISLEIIEIGETKLELYNIFGEKVKTILNENVTNIGSRELSINLNELGSGQYMLIFTSPTIRGMEKVVVVR